MRDDLKKLPLPPEAKSYARRKGLAAMKKQPQSYINMVAAVTNQRSKKHGFKNVDAAGKVPHAIKEDARWIVTCLLETETDQSDYEEFAVWKLQADLPDNYFYYAIETPYRAYKSDVKFHNDVLIATDLPQEQVIAAVEKRMSQLANDRNYPPVAFFTAPWGMYLIHNKTVSRIS